MDATHQSDGGEDTVIDNFWSFRHILCAKRQK